MIGAQAQSGSSMRRAKREVVDVIEPKVQDKSLDKLLHVRKQRISRLEREFAEAGVKWREARGELRAKKVAHREALKAAEENWRQAREDFLAMSTTSGGFRKSKGIYERMKREAYAIKAEWLGQAEVCKKGRTHFFEARAAVRAANRQQEKLTILRDELKLLNQQPES